MRNSLIHQPSSSQNVGFGMEGKQALILSYLCLLDTVHDYVLENALLNKNFIWEYLLYAFSCTLLFNFTSFLCVKAAQIIKQGIKYACVPDNQKIQGRVSSPRYWDESEAFWLSRQTTEIKIYRQGVINGYLTQNELFSVKCLLCIFM